jgi:septum formation protein
MTKFILASGSARRKDFLTDLGYDFDVISADIDESPKKAEKPRDYVKRLAIEKALEVFKQNPKVAVLAADTVCAMGRNIFGKPENAEQAKRFLIGFAGSSHRVYSAICLVTAEGKVRTKVVETRLKFKPLSQSELNLYVSNETNWRGFAGGYAIQNTSGQALLKSMTGSLSSVIGLPLVETINLLKQLSNA